MIFTSLAFMGFCLCVYPLYFLVARWARLRNLFIIAASYLFYGWWDWRFLFLILATTSIDYQVGRWIEDAESHIVKRRFLIISLISNLGVLGFFKYFNFFIDSFDTLLGHFGVGQHIATLNIILPVGISFYTFQSLSYIFDVYRAKIRAEREANVFFAFVAFFPQLAAGPIERAGHMLPQFRRICLPTAAEIRNGVWFLICGFFTKMVVADTLAPWVNDNFQTNQTSGWSSILATIAFGIQIYGDFKGYSLIAKGLAALLGFEIMWNFSFPYCASSVQEFWHRWHISLSTWLRDYLYIPLGGNRGAPLRVCFNIMLTMVLGGLWHGASWNFLIWGLWHGAALCINHLSRKFFGQIRFAGLGWLLTMLVVMPGWFIFRATEVPIWHAMLDSLRNMAWSGVHTSMLRLLCVLSLTLAAVEYLEYRNGHNNLAIVRINGVLLCVLEAVMIVFIFAASQRTTVSFIYFQF